MTDAKRLVLEELDTWNGFMETKGFYDSWARTIAKIEGILARALKDRLSTEAATRNAALELAAQVCYGIASYTHDAGETQVARQCAGDIRALKSGPVRDQPDTPAPTPSDAARMAHAESVMDSILAEDLAPGGVMAAPSQMAAEREALAKWFYSTSGAFSPTVDWSAQTDGVHKLYRDRADALLSSGIVRPIHPQE